MRMPCVHLNDATHYVYPYSKNAGYGAQRQSMARSAKEGKRGGGGGGGGSHSQNNSEFPEVPKLIAQSIVELIA
jgi:hypothetical protein